MNSVDIPSEIHLSDNCYLWCQHRVDEQVPVEGENTVTRLFSRHFFIWLYDALKWKLDKSEVRAAKQRKAAYLEKDLRAILNGRLPLCVCACKREGDIPALNHLSSCVISTGWCTAFWVGRAPGWWPPKCGRTWVLLRPRGGRSSEGENKQRGCKEEQTLFAGPRKPNWGPDPNRLEVGQTHSAVTWIQSSSILRLHLTWSI